MRISYFWVKWGLEIQLCRLLWPQAFLVVTSPAGLAQAQGVMKLGLPANKR